MKLDEKIKSIWKDEKEATDIILVLDKNNLSFDKLTSCCCKKGQNILEAMGAVLAMHDLGQKIIQCQCGEVMSFSDEIHNRYLKTYGNNVLCKRCDSEFMQKMQALSGRNGTNVEYIKKWK